MNDANTVKKKHLLQQSVALLWYLQSNTISWDNNFLHFPYEEIIKCYLTAVQQLSTFNHCLERFCVVAICWISSTISLFSADTLTADHCTLSDRLILNFCTHVLFTLALSCFSHGSFVSLCGYKFTLGIHRLEIMETYGCCAQSMNDNKNISREN